MENPDVSTIEKVIDEAINNGEYVPDELGLHSEISILVDVPISDKEDETKTEKQEWVYNFSKLSPRQYKVARNLLLYEHELLVNPLVSHQRNLESQIYEIECDLYQYLLIRKTGEDEYDTYSDKRYAQQKKDARRAFVYMTGNDSDKLEIIKKNFSIKMNIPLRDRTEQFKNLVMALTTMMSGLQVATENKSNSKKT